MASILLTSCKGDFLAFRSPQTLSLKQMVKVKYNTSAHCSSISCLSFKTYSLLTSMLFKAVAISVPVFCTPTPPKNSFAPKFGSRIFCCNASWYSLLNRLLAPLRTAINELIFEVDIARLKQL
ncbi:hypothetical protein SDJN02_11853, partial [Cucurbita argyrosperma subsp. argyrosperma]